MHHVQISQHQFQLKHLVSEEQDARNQERWMDKNIFTEYKKIS